MPAPFYNAIKGTTAGTPGTGAFTPNAASAGFRAWSNVPTGWLGLVRYEDGSAWELSYSYWNGTTLSRGTNQRLDSSTGSVLTLTSSATAAAVMDAFQVMGHLGEVPWRGWFPIVGSSSFTSVGITAPTIISGGIAAISNVNYMTEQPRILSNSATTANAQAGAHSTTIVALNSTTAGRGGYELSFRFGANTLPTGPRVFIGLTSATFVGNTGEPSAFVANYAILGKDSTDTNLQLITNSNAGGGTKTDTGITLVANGWYELTLWCEPGEARVHILLIRLDTGAIFLGSTTTDLPVHHSTLMPQLLMGLSATTGTAVSFHMGTMLLRTVS